MRGGELLCNRDTLAGTVLNLVENAIQACGPELRLEGTRARADSLRLSASDNDRAWTRRPWRAWANPSSPPDHRHRVRPGGGQGRRALHQGNCSCALGPGAAPAPP